jgi:EAL domain-containing protein (putative c-di-GMP-specific phosphodiesterase class I)
MQSSPPMLFKNDLEAELHKALIHNEFILHYQPQFHIASAAFKGIEALVRWQHPARGLLFPADFIEHAEKSELIVLLGNWVLKSACSQFKSWQEKGLSPVRIAVNVSGRQFKTPGFVDFILDTLAEVDLSPYCLELELNENMIIEDHDEEMIRMIHKLSEAGILIALDDFGTGNFSIQHLQKIPVNRIKIDKTYVQNIQHRNNASIIKALIKLAASLNLEIVAEGVETTIQLERLLAYQCHEIQGYYFSQPLPAEQIELFLIKNQSR